MIIFQLLEPEAARIKLYKKVISESGMGQSCYPVLNDYIHVVTESDDTGNNFSKQMNQLVQLPMERTKDYFNELVPLQESIVKLFKSKGADVEQKASCYDDPTDILKWQPRQNQSLP